MVKLYVLLIGKGLRTLDQVPLPIRKMVEAVL